MFKNINEIELKTVIGGQGTGQLGLFAHALRQDLAGAQGNVDALQKISDNPDPGINLGFSQIARGE